MDVIGRIYWNDLISEFEIKRKTGESITNNKTMHFSNAFKQSGFSVRVSAYTCTEPDNADWFLNRNCWLCHK